MTDGDVAALLPARSAVLAQVFPVLRRAPQAARETAGPSPNADPQELRQRAFRALRELFTRVALRCPTVIAIDDLQWADDDGLRALSEVLRPPDPPPMLFIGTLRKGAGGGDEALARVRAAIPDGVRLIELSGLGHTDARELAVTLLGRGRAPDVHADKIASEAGGHPLFLEELAHHVMVGGRRGEVKLDDAIWSRVENIDRSQAREQAPSTCLHRSLRLQACPVGTSPKRLNIPSATCRRWSIAHCDGVPTGRRRA